MSKDTPLIQTIQIGDKEYEMDLEKDLAIQPLNLNDNCIDQSPKFAWFAVLAEEAKAYAASVKERVELVRAEQDGNIRARMLAEDIKITETKVAMSVRETQEFRDVSDELIEANRISGILSVAAQSFNHRKDMLITLAANARHQGDSEIGLKEDRVEDMSKKLVEDKQSVEEQKAEEPEPEKVEEKNEPKEVEKTGKKKKTKADELKEKLAEKKRQQAKEKETDEQE